MGHQKYTEAYPLQLHHHEDCYEFVFVEQGSVTWEMNGKFYPTHAGQWFYTCPGELHRARFNYLEPSRIWWFIIKDPNGPSPHWFHLEAADRDFIMDQLQQQPEQRDAVIRFVNHMEQHPEKHYSVADIARSVQFSESHFYKIFHQIFGQSPAAYMERVRIDRACELLKSEISITEVAFELGFKTSQHFAKVFKKQMGSSPSEWRKQLL